MSATMRSRLSFQQRCMRPCSRRAVVACHATASEQRKQRLVFLGTPEVCACIWLRLSSMAQAQLHAPFACTHDVHYKALVDMQSVRCNLHP